MADFFKHEVCDAITPDALAIVGAVRTGDPAEFLEALARARINGGPGWVTALVVTLAAMVPDDRSPAQLLEWMADL